MKSIALVGNPNSGKSTLFNALTGSTVFVGNWPGVTVEKKEGKTKLGSETVKVMDTPGIYSLSPYSNEEIITRDYILKEHPDVVIDIVDASNLERNLYLTTQILELGVPVVVALNMIDVVKKKGEELSAAALSKHLGCPVFEISAINNTGVDTMMKKVDSMLTAGAKAPEHTFNYADDVDAAIADIAGTMVAENVKAPVASNEFVALKMLSNDTSVFSEDAIPAAIWDKASTLRGQIEKKYDDDFDSVIAEQRYTWIKSIIGSVIVKKRKEQISLSDKIDRVLTNKILALPIFFAIIYAIYFVCLNPSGLGKKLVGITFGWVFQFLFFMMDVMTKAGIWPWLTDLVCNGVIFGVGIVVAFVPYLMILFIFLALLEECGYMARVTFIFDRVFRRFGLSGKSFIPMLLGTGCTVQAVASTRTIEDENDRKMTIYLLGYIPCATMMPTVILIVSLFAGSNAMVAPLVYLVAICFVILGGVFLKHTLLKGEPAPFVMELPEYKIPRPRNVWHFVWERTVSFFKKASSIIVITAIIVWFFKNFTFGMTYIPGAAEAGLTIENSMLAAIGKFLVPIFTPLGVSSWQILAALLTSYVAKDNMLGTLAQIMGVEIADASVFGSLLTPAGAVGLLVFFVLSSPCFATMGAMRKELGSRKEAARAVGFQMISAYLVAIVAYQVLRLFM